MSSFIALPCPSCGARLETKDSRPTTYRNNAAIRRRRKCKKCAASFTTYEVIARDNEVPDGRLTSVIGKLRATHESIADLIEQFDVPPSSTVVNFQKDRAG